VTGFNETFVMATVFLLVCVLASLLVPDRAPAFEERPREAQLIAASES
jgi:hypothetical protein